jgi:hypothetical integral membrane protein (TIGR02206 family)
MSEFSLFGLSHLLVLGLLVLGSVLIFTLLPKLKTLYQRNVGLLLAIGLLGQLMYFYIGHFIQRSFDPALHLPLHLCSLSAYLVIFALLLNKPWLDRLVLFWSPISALIAIVLPDMGKSENFPSFRFIEFFWSHILIVWGCVYILRRFQGQIRYRDLWINFGYLMLTLPIIKFLNSVFKANYMYLEKRTNGGQMGFLPNEPFHVIGLILIIITIFHLEYIVYKLVQRKSH